MMDTAVEESPEHHHFHSWAQQGWAVLSSSLFFLQHIARLITVNGF